MTKTVLAPNAPWPKPPAPKVVPIKPPPPPPPEPKAPKPPKPKTKSKLVDERFEAWLRTEGRT